MYVKKINSTPDDVAQANHLINTNLDVYVFFFMRLIIILD
jgi:hypothetical protein